MTDHFVFSADTGMRLSELIMWYLEQVESEIDDIDYATLVVRKIIKRLLKTVSITTKMVITA